MEGALLFHSGLDDPVAWRAAMAAELPDLPFLENDSGDPDLVHYALVWKPPHGFFARYRNLRLVVNLGAGVDSLLGRGDLPAVPISRLLDPNMASMMANYVLFAALRYARDIPEFEAAQRRGEWRFIHPRELHQIRVGVLGLGELGSVAAAELARQGFAVTGWSRSPRSLPGVTCLSGMEALPGVVAGSELLIVMLPLTVETQHLLDAELLAKLPRGAKLINVSRGQIIVEDALVAALGSGALGGATLDVFETEPLPAISPLWRMENVLITPHVASVAIPRSSAAQVAESIRRVTAGETPLAQVDPARGY